MEMEAGMVVAARRLVGVTVLTLAAVVAVQGPALADTPLTKGSYIFHAVPPTGIDSYSTTIDGGWWNAVPLRGYRYDYDLSMVQPGGETVGSSTFSSYQQDWVAINGNDTCSRYSSANVGGSYTAVARYFGSAPASQGDMSPGYRIARRGGVTLSALGSSSPDQFTTVMVDTDQADLQVFDIWLNAGTYRIAWDRVHVYYEGGLFVLPAADAAGGNCVKTRANTAASLWHTIETVSGDQFATVRSGEVRYTAPVSGWYGLVLTLQTWDLRTVSLGADNMPRVMVKRV
jgi:hypothetical protein